MDAVSYIRVSSTKQLDGDGPERQRDATHRFATTRQFNLVHEFVEDVSGTKGAHERPVFAGMLEFCAEHGITTVLVESPMRFARDLAIALVLAEDCRRRGISIIDCSTGANLSERSDDPISRFVHQILFAVAELNKNIFVQMTAKARRRIRELGRKCDGRKGYRDLPQFAATMDRIRELHHSGLGPTAIADRLNAEQVPTMNGKPWKRGTVHQILGSGT
jgi:DNA invertase Pin-like site-specific DNA recombinase